MNFQPIQIPKEIRSKCRLNRHPNGTIYVNYVLWEQMDPVKKYARSIRKSIGKVLDWEKGLIYPNWAYFELFPDSPRPKSTVLSYLSYVAIIEIAKLIGLYEPLMAHFPARFIDILTLACAIIINNESIACKVTDFIFDHYTELTHQLSSSFLSKLYRELGEDLTEIEAFFDDFFKSHTEIFETNPQIIIDLDSTNFTTRSILAIAAKGFNKDHLNLPCVGKMTLTLRETGIPIWSHLFNGSILDKSQGLLCIEPLREKGIKNGLICMDRGFWNTDIFEAITKKEDGLNYLIPVPEHLVVAKELIETYKDYLPTNFTSFILAHNLFGVKCEKDGKFYYVFFDPNKKLEVHNHVVDKTCQKLGVIQSRKRYNSLPESPLVIVEPKEKDGEGRDFIAYENPEGIQKAQDKSGWFILCSSLEMTPQEAYEAYKCRAAGTGIEGTFRTLKSFLGGRVMRTHNENTTRGKDFVLTIATILRRGMEYLFKPVLFKNGRKSLPKAIKELDHYKIQSYRGRVRPVQRMTRLQKELMKTLGLKEEDIVGKIVGMESWVV